MASSANSICLTQIEHGDPLNCRLSRRRARCNPIATGIFVPILGGFPFYIHAHMLRHAAGYRLAGDGHDTRSIQDYLGHRNIQHTVRYIELSPTRFKDFWRS